MHGSTDIDAQTVYRYVKWVMSGRNTPREAAAVDIGPHPLWVHLVRQGVAG